MSLVLPSGCGAIRALCALSISSLWGGIFGMRCLINSWIISCGLAPCAPLKVWELWLKQVPLWLSLLSKIKRKPVHLLVIAGAMQEAGSVCLVAAAAVAVRPVSYYWSVWAVVPSKVALWGLLSDSLWPCGYAQVLEEAEWVVIELLWESDKLLSVMDGWCGMKLGTHLSAMSSCVHAPPPVK